MNKRTVLCSLIFAMCVFCGSVPIPASAQGIHLAQQVFRKHNKTFQRADVQEVLPQVLEGLKAPDTQALLSPLTINAVIDNPDLLPRFIPDIEPRFVALLKRDQELKNFLRDPPVQRLLQSPAAIDALADLLGVSAQRPPDLPAQQIYNQAIHSVVWIYTRKGNRIGRGSGVLIDKDRRLVVTNQHVTRDAERIHVFFPWRNQHGQVNKNQRFYEENYAWFRNRGYATEGKVIKQNVRNDLAIIRLDRLFPGARKIKHDFTKNVENGMRRGDKVHILGNPGNRLWNWDPGTFVQGSKNCLPSGGDCLELEADGEPGNSGGPVLNGQGTLIGILTAGTDETMALASPAKNVKALLKAVPANLPPIPPKRTYPKRVFKIRNHTGVTIPYQIRWSNSNSWQSHSLKTGFIKTHWSNGQNIPSNYPKIRFDHIAGDQVVTHRTYNLGTVQSRGNNDHAPIYRFQYNRWGNRLNLFRDAPAAPALSQAAPEETVLLSNYPNPSNPETWIPYHLAKPAAVTVTIYAADGRLIRTLALGHQPAGVYQDRSRAAYWDGTNAQGEPVASGVYFYTLKTEDFTATRKMLIRK